MMRLFIYLFILLPIIAKADCDCGSTDVSSPCYGTGISVTVPAGIPNGGTAINGSYSYSFNSGGGQATCGKFADGSYWVAPASGEVDVTITSISTTATGNFAAELDTVPESTSLIGRNKAYGNYSAGKNIIPSLPLTLSGTKSIVAAIERNEAVEGNCGTSSIVGGCADSYNIVTVLSAVPPGAGSTVLRPNITGTSKVMHNISEFDFTRIPSLDFFTGPTTQQITDAAIRWRNSTEIFAIFYAPNAAGWSEGGRAFRSHTLLDDYGGGAAKTWGTDLTRVFSDDITLEQKLPIIYSMLAYGQDVYRCKFSPPSGVVRWFGVGATQSAGKFPAAVFYAALLKDQTYLNALTPVVAEGIDMQSIGPHETGQIHPGINRPVWGDVIFGSLEIGAYWGSLFASKCYDGAVGTCNVTIGKRTGRDPYKYIDGPANRPGANYMLSSASSEKVLALMMAYLPGVFEAIDYPELIEYLNRLTTVGIITDDDLCVTPDTRENSGCNPYYTTSSGCAYYGVTWGDDGTGHCITTATPPYTKVGRFVNLDRTSVGLTYDISEITNNWTAISDQFTCSDIPSICSDEITCVAAGWNWCSGSCQQSSCSTDPEPDPGSAHTGRIASGTSRIITTGSSNISQ